MGPISAGVGRSAETDAYKAGASAALDAKEKIGGEADILIVFAGSEFSHEDVLDGITEVFGDTPMVGGSTAGEISTEGFSVKSVVVMAIASDELDFTTGIGLEMDKGETECGAALVRDIERKNSLEDAVSLIIFPSGMSGDGVEVISGIYDAMEKPVEIVGGLLGDGERFEKTYQYYNGNVYKHAIVGLLLSSKKPFSTGVGVRSGFKSIGNRMYCTESSGNIVKEIDGNRALDLYMELLGAKRSERLPEVCLEYPFGLIDETVEMPGTDYFQLRCGLTVDRESGTITVAGSIPKGSPITITTGSRGDLIKGVEDASRQALESLGDATPSLILVFSCVGRRLVLGRRVEEEVQTVQDVFGKEVPLIGFYTYGEIGPVDKEQSALSAARFHNETVVIWVLGR